MLNGLLNFIAGELCESHFTNQLPRETSYSKLVIKDNSFCKLPSCKQKYKRNSIIDASLNNVYVIFLDDE